MRFVPLSGEHKSVEAIWDWYQFQSQLSLEKMNLLFEELRLTAATSDPFFLGMDVEEIRSFFKELDYLAMFDLIAATEAALRLDYRHRVQQRKKDGVSRRFRQLHKTDGELVSLDQHILSIWRQELPVAKAAIGDFLGALRLRHWLAHGRWWMPKLGKEYTPRDVFDISQSLLSAITA